MLAENRSIVRGSSTKQETVRINAPGSICLELWHFIGTLDVYFGAEYLHHSRIPFLLILHPAAAAAESLRSCPSDSVRPHRQQPPGSSFPAAHLKKETPGTDTNKWVGEVFKVSNILSLPLRSRWT